MKTILKNSKYCALKWNCRHCFVGLNIFCIDFTVVKQVRELYNVNGHVLNVFDLNGKRVLFKKLQFGQNTVDLSSLHSGLYMVKILSQIERPITKKIILK